MLLLDSSVWIDYLRGHRTAAAVRQLIKDPVELVTTEPIVMELLAGADTPTRAKAIEQLVNGLPVLSVDPHLDFRSAASHYLSARRSGHTVRSIVDCLIAAVAIRTGAQLVHADADYDVLAACTTLAARRLS